LSALERAAHRHQRPATRQAVPTSDEEARKRSNTPRPDLWCRSDRGAHGVVEHSSTSNTQSLFAPADSTRPKTVGLWPAMRRSPAAEHLAAPPVARLVLRTARDTLEVCRTVPASDRVGIATVAPHPELREATCGCVETKKAARTAPERHATGVAIDAGALLRATSCVIKDMIKKELEPLGVGTSNPGPDRNHLNLIISGQYRSHNARRRRAHAVLDHKAQMRPVNC